MGNSKRSSGGMIAAERRRQIYEWALRDGSVSVNALAEALDVGTETIRRDLDTLDREGKLVRSYGGAIVEAKVQPRPQYSEVRTSNLLQKAWIGEEAAKLLPENGSVFFGAGSTIYQLAIRVPESSKLHIITSSAVIAQCLAERTEAQIDLFGGRVRRDSFATDCYLSREFAEMLYWDITFMGAAGLDPVRGLTSVDAPGSLCERQHIEHGGKTIILCDSSKLGRFSYAKVGPVNLIDTIITDTGAKQEIVEAFIERGVEVILAGPEVASLPSKGEDE